jgi:hypothetical protein
MGSRDQLELGRSCGWTYRWVVVVGISMLECQSLLSTPNLQHTTNSDSDLRELDEVNVRLAARPVACLEVPKNVRARDMVWGDEVYDIGVVLANDRILVGSLLCYTIILSLF